VPFAFFVVPPPISPATPQLRASAVPSSSSTWPATPRDRSRSTVRMVTTYGHWEAGKAPWVVSVRLKLEELDERAKSAPKVGIPKVTS
jgi:hypothetical protein